jgi:voltage-gated potassium channel
MADMRNGSPDSIADTDLGSALPVPLKRQVRQALEEADSPLGLVLMGAIALLILLSALLFAVQTYPLPDRLRAALKLADQIILALFTVEYLLRLWASERPWRFVFSLYGLIDLVAVLPFVLTFVLSFVSVSIDTRFLRLIRGFRILRLARFFEQNNRLGYQLGGFGSSQRLIFARILFTLGSIVFIYAGAIYQVEQAVNREDFGTFLDAVYFAVVTMTTVGFGDITPVSEAGRGLTIMMILTGVVLIPTQVGEFIQQVVKARTAIPLACEQCGVVGHEQDARFCRRCGAVLPESVV